MKKPKSSPALRVLETLMPTKTARVVAHVLEHGPASQTDLQRAHGWTVSMASKAVSAGVLLGYLERGPGEPSGIGQPSPIVIVPQQAQDRIRSGATALQAGIVALRELGCA